LSTNPTVANRPPLKEETWLLDYVGWSWLVNALKRQDDAIFGALLATWTGLPLALFGAVAGLFLGAIVGAIGLSVGGFAGSVLNQGTSLLGALLGAVIGAGVGLIFIYVYLFVHPVQLLGALVGGAMVSVVIFYVTLAAEPWMLWLRGYRPPSRREKALLDPLLSDLARRMKLPALPAMWISEAQKPGAWTHTRAIVVTRGLLGEYDASEGQPKPDLDTLALSAILAHELHHWMKGDAVGLAMVSACFYPFVLSSTELRGYANELSGLPSRFGCFCGRYG
jgi:Zn-dependent protease with chaperone function